MRNRILLLLLSLFCLNVMASPSGDDLALQKVVSFLNAKAGGKRRVSAVKKADLKKVQVAKKLYAYNVRQQDGFVLVSSVNDAPMVLGYSDHGTLNTQHMPEGLKDLIANYHEIMTMMENGQAQAKNLKPHKVASVQAKSSISPMVTCKWNQGDPYNLYTPSYVDKNGVTNAHSATGCVATAMAQVMYFWKWPQDSTAVIPSYSYNWSGNSRTLDELPRTRLKWEKMTDEYNTRSTQEAKEAVSELMVYVGHALKMGYAGASGAGVTNTVSALKDCFDYNPDLYWASQTNYTYKEWSDLIYNELSAGRPLIMNADNYERTGGHEFVVDGYDADKDLYHINWGWGGWDDGYFVLTVMAPDNQGIGGTDDANGYSMGQGILVNVKPDDGKKVDETVRLSISGLSCGNKTITRTDGVYNLSFSSKLRNTLHYNYYVDYAFRLFDADGNVVADTLGITKNTYFNTNAHYSYCFTTAKIAQALADGTYYLKGISRKTGTDDWYLDLNADANYLKLTVAGDKMNVEVLPGEGFDLHVDNIELEGESTTGEWQMIKYTITNNGDDFYGDTYMFLDGVRSSGNTIAVAAGETKVVTYKFKVPATMGAHQFILSSSTSTDNSFSTTDLMLKYPVYWDAQGNLNKFKSTTSIRISSDMRAAYVPGTNPKPSLTTVNPNVLLYFDKDATVTSRQKKIFERNGGIIVMGDSADDVVLSDSASLYIPKSFKVNSIAYTRNNVPAWSTIVLPFAIQKVTVDGSDIDWFHSETDEGKALFLKQLSGYRAGKLFFRTFVDEAEANKPYLLGCAGKQNGSTFDWTGKRITFSAENVTVAPSSELTDAITAVAMVGSYLPDTISSAYFWSVEGNKFVKKDKEVAVPFQAYIMPKNAVKYAELTISFPENEDPTGIQSVRVDNSVHADNKVYNLNGVAVGTIDQWGQLPHGIYICKGKKIVK